MEEQESALLCNKKPLLTCVEHLCACACVCACACAYLCVCACVCVCFSLVTQASRRVLAAKEEELVALRQQVDLNPKP
jgi:hypothetical protein